MTINIESVHFDADSKLLDFANEKVNKLTTYYDGIINSQVTLKLDKSNTTENKMAEIKMLGKGHEFFAKRQCATFEEAIDETCEALKNQLKKYKEKLMQI